MAEPDPKINEAIAFFEQMLQTMPGDRTSLEFLSVAYEQTGQGAKQRECLIKLADCLIREKDYDNAQVIAARLSAFRSDPAACAAAERVAELIQGHILETATPSRLERGARLQVEVPGIPGEASFQESGMEVHALSRSASAAEMELVWYWKENDYLPKDVCMDVLHVLTERPMSDVPVLISALALLDEQHPELTDRLMEAMQRASEMPPIPLELFEVQPDAMRLLSANFVHVKGVLPFAILGGEALVAVLNPLNVALREETAARVGLPCHFFFVHPRVWQQVAQNIV